MIETGRLDDPGLVLSVEPPFDDLSPANTKPIMRRIVLTDAAGWRRTAVVTWAAVEGDPAFAAAALLGLIAEWREEHGL